MNIFLTCIPISLIFWSMIIDIKFILITIIILITKEILVFVLLKNKIRKKRKFFFLKEPINPTCFGKVRINLEKIDKKLFNYNKENKTKITYTHIALKSIGEALKKNKNLNGYYSFKNLKKNKKVNINLPIDYKGEDVTVKKIINCGKENIRQISQQTLNIKKIIKQTEEKKKKKIRS